MALRLACGRRILISYARLLPAQLSLSLLPKCDCRIPLSVPLRAPSLSLSARLTPRI